MANDFKYSDTPFSSKTCVLDVLAYDFCFGFYIHLSKELHPLFLRKHCSKRLTDGEEFFAKNQQIENADSHQR